MKILEVVLFLAVTLPQINRISGTVPGRCQDESWALFEGKCYKAFGPAVSLGGERNHIAARDFCVSLDGYLVSINSETEQSFVNKLMPSGISYWIGLFSIETVQTRTAGWQWADGTVFSYTHWGFNEPNSNSERCVETISTPNIWNDHFCTYEKSFVCEVVAEPVTCSDISFPDPNGMITDCQNSNEPPAGTVCRYVCYPEYVLEGDETRTCQEDGSWSGTDDHSCKVVTCQALVFDDPNGQITGCDNEMDAQIDTVCNFECDSGYTLEGQTSRRCEENGLWSGQAEQFCKVVTCSELSFEGTIECIPENSIEFDTACVFSCPLGKAKISGDVIRFCQADGQWSGIMPVCGALMCSLLTFPAGSVVCNPSDSIVYGTVCSFECPSGYEPDVPGLTMTCEADQDWSGSMPTSCQPVDCGSYPDVLNGQSMCDGTTYQKTCFAICNLGYKVKNAQSQCMADGQWGVPALECSRIICSDLDFNNQPGKMTCNPPGFGYPSTCSFICFDGYELKGSETLTCQKDAMWDDIEPTCLDVYCPALSLEGGIVDCSDEWSIQVNALSNAIFL
uniref:P-selectin-like n=1 Tax=Styela clava TaxID=7725 RepID=UPI00193965BD|nr:P-selectin-like [Styela clava]